MCTCGLPWLELRGDIGSSLLTWTHDCLTTCHFSIGMRVMYSELSYLLSVFLLQAMPIISCYSRLTTEHLLWAITNIMSALLPAFSAFYLVVLPWQMRTGESSIQLSLLLVEVLDSQKTCLNAIYASNLPPIVYCLYSCMLPVI